MEKETFGVMVARLRKERGMTQSDLAEKMCVTDKAVSKWERDISYPDIASLPKLAEILGVSVDELMQANNRAATPQASNAHNIEEKEKRAANAISRIAGTALKAVALAMGVAVAALSIMQQIEADAAIRMLGLGFACVAIVELKRN